MNSARSDLISKVVTTCKNREGTGEGTWDKGRYKGRYKGGYKYGQGTRGCTREVTREGTREIAKSGHPLVSIFKAISVPSLTQSAMSLMTQRKGVQV